MLYFHMKGGFTILTNKTDPNLHALTGHMNNHRTCRHGRHQCVYANCKAVGLQYWDPECCCSANQWKLSWLTKR